MSLTGMTIPSAEITPYPRLIVDRGAICRNYARLQTLTHGADVAAVVKANAYGLGAAEIAPALGQAGVRQFFVANGIEGEALREAIDAEGEIFLLHGYWPQDQDRIQRARLIPVINTPEQLRDWFDADAGDFALHFDTGINRSALRCRNSLL